MVLGLIDFLLGGKKKNKVSRSGQVTTSLNNVGGQITGDSQSSQSQGIPNGTSNNATQNMSSRQGSDMHFEDSSGSSTQQQPQISQQQQPVQGQKRLISEALSKIHSELKDTNEKMGDIVTDVKTIQTTVNTLGHRVDELEENKKETSDKLAEVDASMTKFLSLYELINNQYNPFVEQEAKPVLPNQEIVIDSVGNSESSLNKTNLNSTSPSISFDELKPSLNSSSKINLPSEDLGSSLVELDTLNIEEAAGDAVPLTILKNNTNSLVTILSWLEYLVKKVGIEETRSSLRYYTETLRWITPEVFFDLDKYLRGMKDKKELENVESLTIKDHIVSLYFISKLNEKALDEKLVKAVLHIIKQ